MLSDLQILKNIRYEEIDDKTDEILAYGFIYELIRFKMRLEDQANYTGLLVMRDCITYPYVMGTAEVGEYYNITSALEMLSFCGTACHYKQLVTNSGWVLKNQVKACETIAEVDLIIDDRPLEYVEEEE